MDGMGAANEATRTDPTSKSPDFFFIFMTI
jgi:hypothetical protein